MRHIVFVDVSIAGFEGIDHIEKSSDFALILIFFLLCGNEPQCVEAGEMLYAVSDQADMCRAQQGIKSRLQQFVPGANRYSFPGMIVPHLERFSAEEVPAADVVTLTKLGNRTDEIIQF